MLLYWGDFDLSRLKYFSFSWNKFCIFQKAYHFGMLSYSGCLNHRVTSIALIFPLCMNRESNLDFWAICGKGEAWEKRKGRFCILVENRDWKGKKEIRGCRCKGKKARIIGRIKAEEKQPKR